MKKIVLISLLFTFLQAFSQSGTEPVKITDLLKIKSLGTVRLSPDGSKAVFTVTSIEPDGDTKWENKYVTQLWMVNTDGTGSPRQLTTKDNSTQPVFSPDGRQIAFTRNADGRSQIFILSLDGGEAVQLTRFKYGANAPKWSPDGKQILFSANVPMRELLKDSSLNPLKQNPKWSLEKPGFDKNEHVNRPTVKADPDGNIEEVRAWLDLSVTDKKAKVFNKLSFQDEMDVNADLGFNHWYIVNVTGNKEPRPITRGFYRHGFADFTPDGKQIILTANMDSLQHPDRALEIAIYIMNNDGTGLKQLFGEEGKTYTNPVISPTGKWLAFQQGTTAFVNIPKLVIVPLNNPAPSQITELPFDRTKQNVNWSDDEKFLYLIATSNGGFPLVRVDLATKKTNQLTTENSGIGSYDLVKDKLVYVKTEVSNPFELYVADAMAKNEKRLSQFNSGWVSQRKLSFPEKKTFVNDKGQTVDYWIMKPVNYEPGKKYPLLLEIHGGPSSMWGPGESTMWHEYQYFCSKGYGVVYCNPRGSGGYGTEFLRANINDWGKGPTSDVLTALDKTIAEGWADTSKLVLTGGSYAGYLVAWIIAHDQRFKAACSQRGVYDLATFFGEGNAWRLVPNYFGGYPWETTTKQILERESPINYVAQIHTPYIIFHGENDRRTGVIQSEMLYRSLKVLGRPVEYVRHPGATHEITRSGNNRQRIDQMLRTWEFFERWIK